MIEFSTKLTKVTVKEIYEAAKKNGLDWLRGEWFNYEWSNNRKPFAACVLGQAAYNLSVVDQMSKGDHSLEKQLDTLVVEYTSKWYCGYNGAGGTIIHWNDDVKSGGEEFSWRDYEYAESGWYSRDDDELASEQQLAQLKAEYGENLSGLEKEDNVVYTADQYTLETYQDVIDMMYDVLSPHFDVVLTLEQHSYE